MAWHCLSLTMQSFSWTVGLIQSNCKIKYILHSSSSETELNSLYNNKVRHLWVTKKKNWENFIGQIQSISQSIRGVTVNNNQRLHCAFSFTFRSMWKPFYSSGMANKLQKILGTPNYKPREIMDYQKIIILVMVQIKN